MTGDLTIKGVTKPVTVPVGGVPFDEPVLMWWNYVARTRDEILAAHDDWTTEAPRFGHVDSELPRINVDPPPWRHS